MVYKLPAASKIVGPLQKGLKEDNEIYRDWWFQARYLIAFACFLANAVSYLMRVNLSVAIVAMNITSTNIEVDNHNPMIDWNSRTRGMVLSSFTWGYLVTQVPLGIISEQFGPRKPLFLCLLISSLATFLFEPAASAGWHWACAARVLLGLAQGGLLPCCHTLLSRWSVPSERGRMTAYAYTGQHFGMILGLTGSGMLAEWHGWKYIFYVSGALGIIVAGLWLSMVSDWPNQHILSSPKERHYIQTSIVANAGSNFHQQPTPWSQILCSKRVWGAVCAHTATTWVEYTLLTEIPSYMNGVFKYNLLHNGLLSSLPYLSMWLFSLFISCLSDFILQRNLISIGTSRKICNSIGQYGAAIGLICLGFVKTDHSLAIGVLTITVAVGSAAFVGYKVNFIDLTPNFAGSVIGFSNSVTYIPCIVAPLLVGDIVTDPSDPNKWRIVFLVSAIIYVIGNTIFIALGTGEVQKWNNYIIPSIENENIENKEEVELREKQ